MELRGRVVVVTGAASGIGRGLAERFAKEGARRVVVADRDEAGAKAVADASCPVEHGSPRLVIAVEGRWSPLSGLPFMIEPVFKNRRVFTQSVELPITEGGLKDRKDRLC